MRTARVVGLSHDGQTLIVATDTGEELAIPADDRLHAALRGDRPRLGQLEIEMDSALRPRDIQSRIRAGESLEEVARMAGLPLDRVERFAAPVLAEREHFARLAMAGSVRRRGETSGHRTLRIVLTERLVSRGVDIDTVVWDSFRMEDGLWSVSAVYRSGESERQAVFRYDPRGRFSVAGNDEARWVLGEQSALKGPQPGRRRPETAEQGDSDSEPTLDLSDELALVRAIQEPVRSEPQAAAPATDDARSDDAHPDNARSEEAPPGKGPRPVASVSRLRTAGTVEEVAAEDTESELEDLESGGDEPTDEIHFQESSHTWDEDREETLEEEAAAEASELRTLYGMLASDDGSTPVYKGLSDASAVPDTDNSGWEPAIVVDYPVEPSQLDELVPADEEWRHSPHSPPAPISATLTESDAHLPPQTPLSPTPTPGEYHPAMPQEIPESTAYRARPARQRTTPQPADERPAPSDPAPSADPAASADTTTPADTAASSDTELPLPQPVNASEGEPEVEAHPGAPKKSTKRKRAAVPSWDEIMFGGPKRPS